MKLFPSEQGMQEGTSYQNTEIKPLKVSKHMYQLKIVL